MSGELAEYEVIVNGTPTTMQLNEADAERLGAKKVAAADRLVEHESANVVHNRSRTAPDKARRTA